MAQLIGKKLGMTQVFEESGSLVPVSVIEVGPCPIVQVKTEDKDGYSAVQLGFGSKRESLATKPMLGHYKASGAQPQRILREMRVDDTSEYKVGESLSVDVFEGADKVDVVGVTKGRGFAGAIKRHGFHRGPETHGSHSHRELGSVGMCATPARIFKGKRMAGRMGGVRQTAKNLRVVKIDAENNLLYVKGAVPGASNNLVLVRSV